jgi:hypothetical protein
MLPPPKFTTRQEGLQWVEIGLSPEGGKRTSTPAMLKDEGHPEIRDC